MGNVFIHKLTEIIEANINDPRLGVNELAGKMGMSYISLHRKLRSLTGKSPNQYIREIRLNKAWELLQDESLTVFEVSSRTGFSTAAYFATCFHTYFGYPPGEARGREEREEREEREGGGDAGVGHAVQGKNNRWIRRWVIAGAAVVLAAAGTIILLTSSGWLREEKSIAVLPFRNIGQDSLGGLFCEFLREEVSSSLEKVKVFDIRSGISSDQYRNTDKTMPEIGRELDADYIVEGSIGLEGDQVKASIQLIDSKADNHFWSHEYSFKLGATYDQLNTIAQHITYNLKTKVLPWEKAAIRPRGTTNDEAWLQYLQGSYWLDAEHRMNWDRAANFFRKAIALDSLWPEPYLGLTSALDIKFTITGVEDGFEERLMALNKAHALKPGPDSYLLLVSYYMDVKDFKTSRKYLRKALRGYPDEPKLQQFIKQAFFILGMRKEYREMLFKTYEMNPELVQTTLHMGYHYMDERDFPNAIRYFNKTAAINPDFDLVQYALTYIEIRWKGNTRNALKIIEEKEKRNPSKGSNTMEPIFLYVMIDIYEGKYDEAITKLANYSLEGFSSLDYRPKYLLNAWVCEYLDKPDLARAYYDSTRMFIEEQMGTHSLYKKEPVIVSGLGMAWAGLGDAGKAHEMAERVVDLLSENSDHYRGPYAMENVAWIYTKTGEYKKALKIIKELLSQPGPLTVRLLELDPKWDALRELPGFKKLLVKYSIPIAVLIGENFQATQGKPSRGFPASGREP